MNPVTPAPDIPGYLYLEDIGSGGFADVYRYEQEMPRRAVAVKVVRAGDFSPESLREFGDEANLMAQLSAHPSIATIHHAGRLDDGRPYLVMEYYPGGSLGERYRTERFDVTDVLAIGVQLSGAVETAHRSGVLHRDIKPSNVLMTRYAHPVLTDFGIASTLTSAEHGHATGVSVPWSPAESLDAQRAGPAADVYSLGATLYALLAGRAPFEVTVGENGPDALAARIRAGGPPPTGRADVPDSLEQLLAAALSRLPQARPTSALSLGRALQRIQQELALAVTPLDVVADARRGDDLNADSGRTHLNRVGPGPDPLDPGQPAASELLPTPAPTRAGTTAEPTATQSVPTAPLPPSDATVRRAAPSPLPDFVTAGSPASRPSWPGIVLDIELVLAVGVTAAILAVM